MIRFDSSKDSHSNGIMATLAVLWSNGQLEGQVNRLKLPKRKA